MQFKALLAGFAAFSVAAAAPQSEPAPDFSADAFRAHVAFLADDRLEGRDAGSRGYGIASRYVAGQFEALGLRPALADGSWLQRIEFLRYRLNGVPALFVSGRRFAQGADVIVPADAGGRKPDGAGGVRRLRPRHASARLSRL